VVIDTKGKEVQQNEHPTKQLGRQRLAKLLFTRFF
jgi:hypothetical protein